MLDRLLALAFKSPRVGLVLCFALGSCGVGYLWASAFGDGLRGALHGAALDNASSYPDADAVMVIALAASAGGLIFTLAAASEVFNWSTIRLRHMLGVASLTAAAGLLLFGISRLFF